MGRLLSSWALVCWCVKWESEWMALCCRLKNGACKGCLTGECSLLSFNTVILLTSKMQCEKGGVIRNLSVSFLSTPIPSFLPGESEHPSIFNNSYFHDKSVFHEWKTNMKVDSVKQNLKSYSENTNYCNAPWWVRTWEWTKARGLNLGYTKCST